MLQEFSRAALLLGADGMDRLAGAHVAVFGIGGVGGAAAEALARAGVGALTLIDNDVVSVSNRNRQIIALSSTVGQPKVEVMAARIHDINPTCTVTPLQMFVTPDDAPDLSQFDYVIDAIDTVTAKLFLIETCNKLGPTCTVTPLQMFVTPDDAPDLSQFDYVIDAIDTVTAKLFLIETCNKLGVPLISSMGTGNKLDPTRFQVADIYKTSVCPLARVIRQECKKRRIKHLKVVFSTEEAAKIPPERYALCPGESKGTAGRPVPASVSFVPPVAGFILAGEVIKDLTEGLR